MTDALLWHVQIFVVTTSSNHELEQNQMSIKSKSWVRYIGIEVSDYNDKQNKMLLNLNSK